MISKKLIGGGAAGTAVVGGTGAAIGASQSGGTGVENSTPKSSEDIKMEPKQIEEKKGESGSNQAEKTVQSEVKSIYKGRKRGGVGMNVMEVRKNLNLEERVGKIKGEQKCKSLGWEWSNGKCTVPQNITKYAKLELEPLKSGRNVRNVGSMDDCINAGGDWW